MSSVCVGPDLGGPENIGSAISAEIGVADPTAPDPALQEDPAVSVPDGAPTATSSIFTVPDPDRPQGVNAIPAVDTTSGAETDGAGDVARVETVAGVEASAGVETAAPFADISSDAVGVTKPPVADAVASSSVADATTAEAVGAAVAVAPTPSFNRTGEGGAVAGGMPTGLWLIGGLGLLSVGGIAVQIMRERRTHGDLPPRLRPPILRLDQATGVRDTERVRQTEV
jgi:hypothetical protein